MTAGPGAGRTPALDGLRGIAVLAVVIEHAWPTVLPGGFAGVDVFFVLSGFLITRMLLGEVARTGTVDLLGFYARRVRRIIPAATVCVVAVVILFTTVFAVGFGRAFRTEALAAALSVSNFLFASRTTDYFAADPSSSPFLHYWSLAVEEQFYLFWPTVLLGLVWFGRRAAGRTEPGGPPARPAVARWLPPVLTAGIAAASLALAISGPETTAFFLLPHRAWELLVGSLLAWVPLAAAQGQRSAGIRAGLGIAGSAALAVAFSVRFEPWPGLATTLPVLGTAGLIVGASVMPGGRWLAAAWLRFFGRISYALYLWHWPILAAVTLIALPASRPPLWMTVVGVLLAVVAAVASTFLIEEPIRFSARRWLSRARALAAAGALVGVSSVAIVALTASASFLAAAGPTAPGSPPDIRSQLADVRSDRERLIDDDCYTTVEKADLRRCWYGAAATPDGGPAGQAPRGMPIVVLFGDSHAMHWFPAVDVWARRAGFALLPLTKSGCVAVDAAVGTKDGNNDRCMAWRQAALEWLYELRPVLTVVSSSSDIVVTSDGVNVRPRRNPGPWIAPAARFLERLRDSNGGSIVYIFDTPRATFEIPDCMAVHWSDPRACAVPVDVAQPPGLVRAEEEMVAAADAVGVDPTAWLCPAGTCTWLLDGRIAYADDHHITATTATVLAQLLGAVLDSSVAQAASR